jgi:hypothetical protein
MTKKIVDKEDSFSIWPPDSFIVWPRDVVARLQVAQTERFGLSLRDGLSIARVLLMPEAMLHGRRMEEFFSRRFFSTEFWCLWSNWSSMEVVPEHSAIEFRCYMNRFKYLFAPAVLRGWPGPLSPPSRPIIVQGRGRVTITVQVHSYIPPKGQLIDWLTPPEYADDRIHGLLTGYDRWVQKYGDRTARRMFLVQSIGVVFGFWVDWLIKHINLIKPLRPS